MPTSIRRRVAVAAATAAVGAIAAAGVISTTTPDEAQAHGSTQVPASRTFSCRFEQPDNPMCAQAWDQNEQALFDWMEVNIANADDRHRELIPDGQLCSAGRDKYAAFNEPGDWPLTQLRPDANGQFEVVFTNTAPHATAYYRFFITRPGFDARTDLLNWADLTLVHDSGPLPAAPENRFTMDLPDRDQPAILYVIWQRSDSPEAFYACSDVVIGDGPPPTTTTTAPTTTTTTPSTTTTTTPSTTTTTLPDDGENPSSPIAGIEATATITSDWDTGFCVRVDVSNATTSPLDWVVHYDPGGTITSLWNAQGDGTQGRITFTGESWNDTLAGGAATNFGLCASRA